MVLRERGDLQSHRTGNFGRGSRAKARQHPVDRGALGRDRESGLSDANRRWPDSRRNWRPLNSSGRSARRILRRFWAVAPVVGTGLIADNVGDERVFRAP